MPHSRKVNGHLALSVLLGFIGASKITGPLKKEIVDDVDVDQKSHKGVRNPNNIELGMKVKFMSGRRGWRIGTLVAIIGSEDGRVCLGKHFVIRKLYLIFPA